MPTTTNAWRKAVFTGTFDPLTLGHLNVIERGRMIFDELVVGIGENPNKQALFSIDERVRLARRIVEPFPNVSVEPFDGLAVHFVRSIGARVILRGVRTLSDMEYEFSMTLTNQRLDPEIETVFLMADGEYSHVSSSLIKQVARFGGRDSLSCFVPTMLVEPIMEKIDTLGGVRTDSVSRPGIVPDRVEPRNLSKGCSPNWPRNAFFGRARPLLRTSRWRTRVFPQECVNSFPRSAWECITRRSASSGSSLRKRPRSGPDGIPTRSMGTSSFGTIAEDVRGSGLALPATVSYRTFE